jgi:hypothetical protein
VDSLFIRPSVGFYYFGDYYGPAYREWGFTSAVVYSRSSYDPIFTYARWEYRDQPSWFSVQLDITLGRHAGTVACPPRTLVQQNTIVNNVTNVTNVTNVNNTNINNTNINNTTVNNNTVLMPATKMAEAKSGAVKVVSVPPAARAEAKQQAQAVQQVAAQRKQLEVAPPAGAAAKPRVSTLKVPQAQPVGKPAVSAAASTTSPSTGHSNSGTAAHPATNASTSHPSSAATASPATGHANSSAAHPATSAAAGTGAHSTSTLISPASPNGSLSGTAATSPGTPNAARSTTGVGAASSTTPAPGGVVGNRAGTPAGPATLHPPTTVGPPPSGHPMPLNGRPPLPGANQPMRSGTNPFAKPPVHPAPDKRDSKQKEKDK